MKKRILSMLLAAIMVLSLVPLMVFADTATYPVWVGGIQVTESNKTNVLGNSSVAFDSEKGILTLNTATFSTTGSASGFNYGTQCVCAVKSELDQLTVNLVGNSQIGKEVTSESSLEEYSVDLGFSCSGDIVFTGDADSSLTVYDYGAGIRAKNVTFGEDFKGKLTVRDCGGPEPQPPCAINAFGVRDESTWEYISDGTVSILGGTFDIESFESNGIAADGNIVIKNAKVTSVAGYNAIQSEYGNITINDSEITVVGDTAINTYEGDILIENANLKVTSTACEGIDGRDITLTGCGKVEINSREDSIYSGRKVSIINCPDIVIDCTELTGIYGSDIFIDNSKIDVTAHDGSGIRAYYDEDGGGSGNITVKDSTATIHAKRNGIDSSSLSAVGGKTYIYSAGDVDSDGKGCGAYLEGDESAISISGSTVKFTGGEAAIKFEKAGETNPFNGTLPKASFKGNTAYDTFTSMEEVNYKSEKRADMVDEFFEIAYVGDELAKSVSAIHVHSLVKVDGQAATEQAVGFKDHYGCKESDEACGALFEDENGTAPIENFEDWKAEGGNGYIPPLAHTVTPVNGKDATDTEAGYKACYECRNCGRYYEDAVGLVEISDIEEWKAEGGNGYLPPLHGTDDDHDHICDSCGKAISDHTDADKDHICEYCNEVISDHSGVLQKGVAATLQSAGFKNYYKCDCGKFFEDATCKVEIADIEKWKAEGGAGYIAKLEEEPIPVEAGDTSHVTLWILLMLVSSMGLCASFVLGQKRKKEQ